MNFFKKFEKTKFLGVFNKQVKSKEKEKKLLFDHMIRIANSVIVQHDTRGKRLDGKDNVKRHPIYDFIRLVGLRFQTHYMTNLLYNIEEIRLPNIDYWHVMFSNTETIKENKTLYDFFTELPPEENESVSLREDLVLPWPWKESRLINSLVNIGDGRHWGEWEEDKKNHNLELWLPVRIAFVNGGNHSINAGILQGVGYIKPKYVYDISPIYNEVYTDGVNYYRSSDNSVIGKALNIEFAVLFEIGRLMKQHKIV